MATCNYCPNCGKKMEALWRTCPFCDISLASLNPQSKVNVSHSQSTVVTNRDEDEEDSDTNYLDRQQSYQPRITALAVEFTNIKPNKNKLADFVRDPFLAVDNIPRNAPPMSKEQFQKDWIAEAGNKPRTNNIEE